MSGACPTVTFADLIFHHALAQPEKPAMALADRTVTYGMVARAIQSAERRIRGLAISPGDLVCIALDNPIRHMVLAAALTRLGHPPMSVADTAVVAPLSLSIAAFLVNPGTALVPGQRHVVVTDEWFEPTDVSLSPRPANGYADERAICRVELSSGTTGRPKAISLTLAAFNQSLNNYSHTVARGEWDRVMLVPGLTNNWGFTLAAHVLFFGKTLFFADTPRSTLQMIALYAIDMLVASIQQVRELVREQTEAPIPCPSLRSVMTGGSLVSQALIADARAKLCSNIVSQYGSTEAGATAFATVDRMIGIEGASGYVAPWAVVEAVDENDRVLPPDTEGTLRIRAGCQGAAYPPDRPDSQSSFREGWFYPGDRGRVRADGLLIVTGRATELINAGGLKLAPDLIEDIVRKHPAVTDVAAVGVPGVGGIEEIALAVLTRGALNERQLVHWCAERNVPVGKVVKVDSLPRTVIGKLNREQLRREITG